MPTTNFPDGVTNAPLNSPFTDMIMDDPTKLYTYFNDFFAYTAADWVVTLVGTGTQALAAGAGGQLLLTNTAAAPDTIVLQKTPAMLSIPPTKRAWFACKFQTSDATQSIIQMGLVIVDSTPLDATDGIYFQKEDNVATVDFYVRKNATTGSNKKSSIATLANATDVILSFYYDGAGRVFYGVNGVLVGSADASSSFLPDATNLTISMFIQNGEAVAKTMTVDYIYAAIER